MSWRLKLLLLRLALKFIQTHQKSVKSKSLLVASIPLIEDMDINYSNIAHVEQFFWCITIQVLDLKVLQGVQDTTRHLDQNKAGEWKGSKTERTLKIIILLIGRNRSVFGSQFARKIDLSGWIVCTIHPTLSASHRDCAGIAGQSSCTALSIRRACRTFKIIKTCILIYYLGFNIYIY